MKLGILTGIAVAGMVSLSVSQSAQGQNLLANPGFETGDFSGWTLSGDSGFEAVSPNFATTPNSGSYSAYFGAVGDYNIISQMIPTTPGDTYNLSFFLANDGGGPVEDVVVGWGSSEVDLGVSTAIPWTQFGWNEVATTWCTEVTFAFRQDPGYYNLDDTSVVDLTQNANLPPVNRTCVPDQGVGLWATAATLLGLCLVAGKRRHLQTA